MNNQGLEALAALASAAPSSASSSRGSGDAKSGERGSVGSRDSGTSTQGGGVDSSSSSHEINTQNTTQTSQNSEQSTNPSQLSQWQQLMSSLAATGGGNANSLASNPNLAFLSGLQQSSQPDHSSLMMAMQNMAQYQLMAQAQAANQNQLSALSNLAMQLSRANQQSGGLGYSLQNPLASFLKGKEVLKTKKLFTVKLRMLLPQHSPCLTCTTDKVRDEHKSCTLVSVRISDVFDVIACVRTQVFFESYDVDQTAICETWISNSCLLL